MEKGTYCIGLDVWEGSLNIDEKLIREMGVEFIAVRSNDMNGGHHLDENFYRQWEEAEDFIRFPYFVYNPWVDGEANFSYAQKILPIGTTTVASDIEVRYPGYSPSTYAIQANRYFTLNNAVSIKNIIYTGRWFTSNLSFWPKEEEYWWARYPYLMYSSPAISITWEHLQARLDQLNWYPDVPSNIPGPCSLWQCSGDSFKLPGTVSRAIDINVYNGSPEDMILRYNLGDIHVPSRLKEPTPPPSGLTLESLNERVVAIEEYLEFIRKD